MAEEQRVLDEAFQTFDGFMEEVGAKPSPSHTLDRRVPGGAYSPGNVRWATKTEQANNRRNTRYLTYGGTKHPEWYGERLPLSEWARRLGVPAGRLRRRIADKWSDTEAIEGDRQKSASRPFSEMTQTELAAYRPWQSNHEQAEARYLANHLPDEVRLEFRLRMIGETADHYWQRLIGLLKEADDANLRSLRYSKQARDMLARRPEVSDDEWDRAYAAWEKVEGQLNEARRELADWSSAVAKSRTDRSAEADRKTLKRIKGQVKDDDDAPDTSWLD
ncbi:MAG: hypothetical protein EOP24_34385 [Hyphomicrobiales bacterium]|nr:MAG: hypothetical protein EOP24_34385 [Hyphomicrobiales bacterium]